MGFTTCILLFSIPPESEALQNMFTRTRFSRMFISNLRLGRDCCWLDGNEMAVRNRHPNDMLVGISMVNLEALSSTAKG